MKKSTMKTIIESLTRELQLAHSTMKANNSYIEELQDRNAELVSCTKTQDKLKSLLADARNEAVAARNSKTLTLIELERFLREDDAPISRIKAIRAITGSGLKEAKDFYEAFMKGHSFQKNPTWNPSDTYNAE